MFAIMTEVRQSYALNVVSHRVQLLDLYFSFSILLISLKNPIDLNLYCLLMIQILLFFIKTRT